MYTITDKTGAEIPKTPSSLTMRLAQTFRREGEALSAFNAEAKALTDKDKADLTAEYERAGYPVVASKGAMG